MFNLTARIDLISEESGYHKISLKEVYSATDNLSADNFIGQGIAGKNLSISIGWTSFFYIQGISQWKIAFDAYLEKNIVHYGE